MTECCLGVSYCVREVFYGRLFRFTPSSTMSNAEKRADGLRQVVIAWMGRTDCDHTMINKTSPRTADGSPLALPLQAVEIMISKLDKSLLRPMQKESYLCMSRCCDSAATPAELQNWWVPRGMACYTPCQLHYVLHTSRVPMPCVPATTHVSAGTACSCTTCEHKVHASQQLISATMSDFQHRLQRCVQRCQDMAQETLSVSPSEKEMAKANVRRCCAIKLSAMRDNSQATHFPA
jgi:hypothetical protein